MPFRPFTAPSVFLVFALSGMQPAAGQNELPNSPFLPPGKTVVSAQASSSDTLQLAGISVIGKKTFVSLFDPSLQRSRWIAVGNTVEGIEVVSCDLAAEQALVRIAGLTKILALRKPTVGTGSLGSPRNDASSPMTARVKPTAPAPAAPLTSQAEKEQEARMFVSDLLEIGLQQRKTYEELQRKAAAEEAAKKIPKS